MKNPATYLLRHFPFATVPIPFNSKIRKAFSRRPHVILVILLSVSLLLQSQSSNAQAPQQFSFQGVARDATGKIVTNAEIGYSLTIHKGTPVGTIKFTREGSTTTDAGGVFNITIGTEAYPIPDDIRWDRSKHYLEVGIDIDGATNGYTFINIGTTELISVPHALHAQESGKWVDGNPIMQTDDNGGYGNTPALPSVGDGPRLIWHPQKAAFRVGTSENSFWDDAQIGSSSFASGKGTRASGTESTALGVESQATAQRATAIGFQAIASGSNSIALGNACNAGGGSSVSIGSTSLANGNQSIALGFGTTSKAFAGIVSGTFNDVSDNPNAGSSALTDRLFQIGNGASNASRSNAITILRNGNVGVGNNVVNPEFIMDFGGRPRVRSSGGNITAGLYLDDSQGNADNFVGMVNDNLMGFFLNNSWEFSVDSDKAYVNGYIVQTSDARLKKELIPLENGLNKIKSQQGYFYKWLDPKRDQSIQTGLMAQDVEKQFPELVTTNKDGYKAVNYTGLIPHLIEAVKELDKKTEEISALKKELASMQEMNKKLNALEASVKELLAGKATTSTQASK